ncbi:MAG TPA: HAD-IA family hydrolase [Polyangiaceae bacterium]|nr:HAD-IA family hydrolase [Polyangiaceae bacterium]
MKAVGFDFGQTLAELDHELLKERLTEHDALYDPDQAQQEHAAAWRRYGELKDAGHAAAWRGMIEVFLRAGGVPSARLDELTLGLWDQQPSRNLWRRPIPGMIELVRELERCGIKLAIISNSEGRLAELVSELGWSESFQVITDSGRLGIDKPNPGIFQHACAELGVGCSELVHVGDSWEADVQGALGVGAQPVWFDAQHRQRELPSGVLAAGSAAELREVLARLGLVS